MKDPFFKEKFDYTEDYLSTSHVQPELINLIFVHCASLKVKWQIYLKVIVFKDYIKNQTDKIQCHFQYLFGKYYLWYQHSTTIH
jgi:hypothetical protein